MRTKEKHHAAFAVAIPIVAIVAVFSPKWIPLALVAAVFMVLAEQFPKRHRIRRAEEDKEVSSLAQTAHADLERMERRIEALETILIEETNERTRDAVPAANAARNTGKAEREQ